MERRTELDCLEEFRSKFGLDSEDPINLQHVNGYGGRFVIEISNSKVKCFYDSDGKFLRKISLEGSRLQSDD